MFNFVSNSLLHTAPIYAEWNIKAFKDGVLVSEETKVNLIVDNGRESAIKQLFGLTASGTVVALAAGACSTAAAHTDYALGYELIANGARIALTDTGGNPLTTHSVVNSNFTDGLGNNYYKALVVQGTFVSADANNGQPFQEYALMTSLSTPATPNPTPFTQTGVMFNHLVAGSPIIKDSSTEIVVVITLRV